MKITRAVEHIFQKYLPSPFTIAILLTLITMVLAVVFTRPSDTSSINYITDILRFLGEWYLEYQATGICLSNDAHINFRSCIGPQHSGEQGNSEDNTIL